MWKHRLVGILSLIFQFGSWYWDIFSVEAESFGTSKDGKWDMMVYHMVKSLFASLIVSILTRCHPKTILSRIEKLEVWTYFLYYLTVFIACFYIKILGISGVPHGIETASTIALIEANIVAAYNHAKHTQLVKKQK